MASCEKSALLSDLVEKFRENRVLAEDPWMATFCLFVTASGPTLRSDGSLTAVTCVMACSKTIFRTIQTICGRTDELWGGRALAWYVNYFTER